MQLHCPPTPVYADDEVFDALDTLVAEQRIAAYGVSVETCDEALTALGRPGVATIQIILNCFRQKPLDAVLPAARAAGVGIIAREPGCPIRARAASTWGRGNGIPATNHAAAGLRRASRLRA